jgi:ABC-type antimicrobial peptide transport system permease subunit
MSSLRIQAVVRPLHEQTVEQARQLVRTLFLATMVVLLIACANLAGLLLVRGLRRRRQIALQMALGAPAGTLLREAVLESLLLSFTGGVFGAGLADIALRVGVSPLPETLVFRQNSKRPQITTGQSSTLVAAHMPGGFSSGGRGYPPNGQRQGSGLSRPKSIKIPQTISTVPIRMRTPRWK